MPSCICKRSKQNKFHNLLPQGHPLAHFKNFPIEPDLLNSPVWEDDYGEFISKLKTYFNSPDIVGEAESKLENLSMKPNQCITKYLVEFNCLATITEWHNRALRHQFYHGLPACIKDEVSWMGNPSHSPNSEPWLNQLMVAIGNEKKRLVENVAVSLRRKRRTSRRVNLPCQTKATRTNIRRSRLLRATPVHPLITPKRKSRTWMTKSGKTENLLSWNEHAALQIIFAFSAEV